MKKFFYILCVFLFSNAALKAQTGICLPLKQSGGFIAFININSPIMGNPPQRFGFIKNNGKTVFNITWDARDTLSDLSKIKLKGSILKVNMDNDSTMVFTLGGYTQMFKNSSYLNLDADITYDQIANFKLHKLISVDLITDEHKVYKLFVFSEQDKAGIQSITNCFLTNVNKSPN